MSAESWLSPHIRLGIQCRDLRRPAEAEKHFREALAGDPLDDVALNLLANVLHAQDGREKEALAVIDSAIAVSPNDASHHVQRGFILAGLGREKEALAAARTARKLDPFDPIAIACEAHAQARLKNWAAAEQAAREALALDADDALAAQILAETLRNQGKTAENAEQIRALLERDPEDATTHYHAGWAALQRGDHRTAEVHFRESLRLEPELEPARDGLLTSFRARSPFYRGYLRYCLRLARMKAGAQWAWIIGILVVYQIARRLADLVSPALGLGVVALYLLFVLWGFVANALGNFILLFDRFARHALRPAERWEAVVVGGGVAAGAALLAVSLPVVFAPGLTLGAAMTVSAIPLSMVFTNKSRSGALLFGTIAGITLGGALLGLVAGAVGLEGLSDAALGAAMYGGIGCLLSTWLAGVPHLRR